ncbi:unnamed protein product [Brassica rapa]|uniref:Uncharacterized protein n=2 Tax=Brassica TaxID=3705 RepID=A0A8D9I5G4_BRACM|nr:unnamed protein product [Brassica napus]CAG7911985.1 unnamed protein product [Brassica rapa]
MCERHGTRYSHMRKIVNEGLSSQQSAKSAIGVRVIKKVQRYWESCFNIICQNVLRFRTSTYGIVLRLRLF